MNELNCLAALSFAPRLDPDRNLTGGQRTLHAPSPSAGLHRTTAAPLRRPPPLLRRSPPPASTGPPPLPELDFELLRAAPLLPRFLPVPRLHPLAVSNSRLVNNQQRGPEARRSPLRTRGRQHPPPKLHSRFGTGHQHYQSELLRHPHKSKQKRY